MATKTANNITDTDVSEASQNVKDNQSPTSVLETPKQEQIAETPKSNGNVSDSNGNYFLPVTQVENRIFLLSNDKRQGTVSLDVEEDVIDPKTNEVRRMRLLRGAHTIWFDEQPPSVFPPAYVNKNVLTLDFNKGQCVIPINEPMKIKAAELTMRNVANKKKYGARAKAKDIYFYEWNPIEQNQLAIEEENDVIKAMQLAMTTPLSEMVAHANYLNIQFADEQGVPLNEEALRAAYIRKAKNEAKKFLNSIHSPTVKIAHMVKKAIDGGKIDLGKQPGAAYWVDGGFISALPEGRDAVEYLIEFAMTHGEANIAFANQLRELT